MLNDSVFKEIRLNSAEITPQEEIGRGAFGRVFKVDFYGSAVVAKELNFTFSSLKGKNKNGKKATLKKFLQVQQLRGHPNIVQLYGVYNNGAPEGAPNALSILVMEKMECSLSALLECEPNISIRTKLSILLDISLGLRYLHCQSPPICHCYLSSNDILLTSQQRAKISDIGIARMVTHAGQKVSPRVWHFIAPEMYDSNGDPSVDVFSYGAVMLHTITQKWPVTDDHDKKELTKQESGVKRYQSYIDQISATCTDMTQLTELVRSCLDGIARNRPKITEVSKIIEKSLVDVTMICQAEVQQKVLTK